MPPRTDSPMVALMARLHFNPDSSYNTLSSTQHVVVTCLQHSSQTTSPKSCFSNLSNQSPLTNTSRVRWRRRRRHLPGRTVEGSVCTSREYVSKLKMAKSKPSKEKASASQCLTVKRFSGDNNPSKSSIEMWKPISPRAQRTCHTGAQKQQQSNTSHSPYTHLKGNLKLSLQ